MENIKILENNEKKLVTRRNDFLEAKYRLSIQEQRLMLWVIANIEPTDTDFQTYRVRVQELARTIKVDEKSFYREMRQTTRKVMGRVIEIEEEDRILQMPLMSKAVYNKKQGTLDVRIDEDLRRYLLQLKDNFTKIRLKYAFQLASTYSLRIYELLVQYRKVGKRRVAVQELRRMLDIADGKYVKWVHFEERVLRAATNEINKKTDIRCRYKKLKNGRKIENIEFLFKTIVEDTEPKDETPLPHAPITADLQRLTDYGVNDKDAAAWVEAYSKEQIDQATVLYEAAKKRGQEIPNPGGWLRRALEKGWTDAGEKVREAEKAQKKMKERQEAVRKEAEELRNAQNRHFDEYRRQCVRELIDALTEDEERQLREEFKVFSSTSLFSARPEKFKSPEVWFSPMIFTSTLEFLERKKGLKTKDYERFLEEDYQPA